MKNALRSLIGKSREARGRDFEAEILMDYQSDDTAMKEDYEVNFSRTIFFLLNDSNFYSN